MKSLWEKQLIPKLSVALGKYQDGCSDVIAIENAQQLDGMYVDESQKGMSFRNYKELLFIGGGDHCTEKKCGNWQGCAIVPKITIQEQM